MLCGCERKNRQPQRIGDITTHCKISTCKEGISESLTDSKMNSGDTFEYLKHKSVATNFEQ